MVTESVAILVICLLLVVSFGRTRYKKAFVTVLPVGILPLVHLIARGLLRLAKSDTVLGFRAVVLLAFFDMLAVVATCVVLVALSRKINTPVIRRGYLVIMIGYSALTGWAYIFDSLSPLLG